MIPRGGVYVLGRDHLSNAVKCMIYVEIFSASGLREGLSGL